MKRFWIGIAMLAVLLAGGFLTQHRMERVHIPCALDLQWSADRAMAGDWEGATGLALRSREMWRRNWYFTAAMVDHQPMDEVDGLFEELEVYLIRQETVSYCAACRFLAQRVMDLGESFRLSWWNLL